jgi:ABC-type bacteriocin/lantibiotic exporter with double-glycine peptidase domain
VGSGTTTADQIMACAESLGYSAQLVSSPVEDLAKDIENGMPVIVAYNPGQYHWSVFAGYDDGFVVLANPWGYYDTVPAGEFSSMFSQTGNLGIKIWKE